jgi:hypothetical protein
MTQKFRKGDIVTVRAVVTTVYDHHEDTVLADQIKIEIDGTHQGIFLKPSQLTMEIPFFAPGERVRTKSSVKNPVDGTVMANDEGQVWVKFDHGKHGTVSALELEPIPAKVRPHVVAA